MCNKYIFPSLVVLYNLIKFSIGNLKDWCGAMVFATNAAHELDSLGEGVASLPPFASHGSIAARTDELFVKCIETVFFESAFKKRKRRMRVAADRQLVVVHARTRAQRASSLSLILARLPAISHRARVNPSDGEERASERPFHARQVQSIRIICLPLTATFLQMYSVKCACSAEAHHWSDCAYIVRIVYAAV
jgi:hypothetical protein